MSFGDECLLDEEWERLDKDVKKEMTPEQFASLNREYYCEKLCNDWSCNAKRKPNYKS